MRFLWGFFFLLLTANLFADVKTGYYCEVSNDIRFVDLRSDGTAVVGIRYDLQMMRRIGGFAGKPEREWLVERKTMRWVEVTAKDGKPAVAIGEPGFETSTGEKVGDPDYKPATYFLRLEGDDLVDGIEGLRFRIKK